MFQDKREAAAALALFLLGMGGGWMIQFWPSVGVSISVLGSAIAVWIVLYSIVPPSIPLRVDRALSAIFVTAVILAWALALGGVEDSTPRIKLSLLEVAAANAEQQEQMRYRATVYNPTSTDIFDMTIMVELPNTLVAVPEVVRFRRAQNVTARSDFAVKKIQRTRGGPIVETPIFLNTAVLEVQRLMPEGDAQFEILTEWFPSPHCRDDLPAPQTTSVWGPLGVLDGRCDSTDEYGQVLVRRRHQYFGTTVDDAEKVGFNRTVAPGEELIGEAWMPFEFPVARCVVGKMWDVNEDAGAVGFGIEMVPAT